MFSFVQEVPLGEVCGAAATAGALNAVREGQGKKRLGWERLLFGSFEEKLGISVRERDGSPVSWRIGKSHIRKASPLHA